jgi:hypothetical protein
MEEIEETDDSYALSLLLIGNGIFDYWIPFLPNSPHPLHVARLELDLNWNVENTMLALDGRKKGKSSEPNVILFYGDSKDLAGKTIEKIEKTQSLLEKIQDEFPVALVVYFSVLKCPKQEFFFQPIDEINEAVRIFSKKPRSDKKGPSRIQIMDLNPILRKNPVFFEEDGIRLNSKGYAIMNDYLVKRLF